MSDLSSPVGTSSRRTLLASVSGGIAVGTAGCLESLSSESVFEVGVTNNTTERAFVSVLLEDRTDETLFNHTFEVGGGKSVSRAGGEQKPASVRAFTADGVAKTWDYSPDLGPEFDCDIKDVGLSLREDGTIEPWYDCS